MSLTGKILTGILFVVLPVIAGGIYSPFLVKRIKLHFADICKLLIQTWIYGIITMFAVMQLIAVPMIAVRTTFTMLVNVWCALLAVLSAAGIVGYIAAVLRTKKHGGHAVDNAGTDNDRMRELNKPETVPGRRSCVCWIALLAAVFVILTGYQARIASKYQHTDDDDARFVALELLAVDEDRMLTHNPIDGYPMYWNTGEVKKDYTSPWTMYVAACSRISGVHPAILSHRLMPMYLVPLCCLAYLLLGLNLFRDDWEKTLIFAIIVSAVNIFGYTSTHTVPSLLLLRIWQGKAVFAGLMVPVILDLLYRLYEDCTLVPEKVLLFVSCMASSLLSGGGIVIAALAVGFYGLVVLAKYRNIKNTLYIWLTCSPCVVYALCNVFWYQVFRLS